MNRHVVEYDASATRVGALQGTFTFVHRGVSVVLGIRVLERGYHRRTRPGSFAHPMPVFSRLFLFLKGGATVRTGTGTYSLRPRRVYLLPAGQAFDVDYRASTLNFYHVFVHDRAGLSVFDGTDGVPGIDDQSLFASITGAFERDDSWALTLALSAAVGRFAEGGFDRLARRAGRMSDMDELFRIVERTPPADMQVNVLADRLHRSRSALTRAFRSSMGIPLKTYLSQVHLQRAIELLQQTDWTVEAIARALGHDEPHYFYRFFRKMTGESPGELRRRLAHSTGAIRREDESWRPDD